MPYNVFRLAGDASHVASIALLLRKVRQSKSCSGVSLTTQQLYFVVFVTRYLDLFVRFIDWYTSVMKVLFIATSAAIVHLMRTHKTVKQTYDRSSDLPMWWFIAPCAAFALLLPHKYTILEILWSFSIYLEAVAIVPQLYMTQQTGNIDQLTSHFVFFLGSYRALYLANWVYRYMNEKDYRAWLVWICGAVQTLLYADFMYFYAKSLLKGKRLKLPT